MSNELAFTKDSLIGDILKAKPASGGVFMSFGMPCIGCMVALEETVGQAAEHHGIDLAQLLDKINSLEEEIS